jgi:phage/plasmid-like protein (TIGR03299 family)
MTAATMFSTREAPWMKLGRLVDEPVTAEEAARLSGLDFDVALAPLTYQWNDETLTFPERYATVRTDNGEGLGVVSEVYEIVQYREAFTFMDTINPRYVAAGPLSGGKQGFMVVKVPENTDLLTDVDPHELYVVLRTSHNCSRAVEVAVMPLRSKCMNGLAIKTFTQGAHLRWSIRHTRSASERMHEAQMTLSNIQEYGKSYAQAMRGYAEMTITDDEARRLLDGVIERYLKSRDEVKEEIIAISHNDETVNEFAGTAWGLINATSSYYQWERALGTPESRFLGMLGGPSNKAINSLVDRINARTN